MVFFVTVIRAMIYIVHAVVMMSSRNAIVAFSQTVSFVARVDVSQLHTHRGQ